MKTSTTWMCSTKSLAEPQLRRSQCQHTVDTTRRRHRVQSAQRSMFGSLPRRHKHVSFDHHSQNDPPEKHRFTFEKSSECISQRWRPRARPFLRLPLLNQLPPRIGAALMREVDAAGPRSSLLELADGPPREDGAAGLRFRFVGASVRSSSSSYCSFCAACLRFVLLFC